MRPASGVWMPASGTKVKPGLNIGVGRDHTLWALVDGHVKFERRTEGRVHVSVLPVAKAAE